MNYIIGDVDTSITTLLVAYRLATLNKEFIVLKYKDVKGHFFNPCGALYLYYSNELKELFNTLDIDYELKRIGVGVYYEDRLWQYPYAIWWNKKMLSDYYYKTRKNCIRDSSFDYTMYNGMGNVSRTGYDDIIYFSFDRYELYEKLVKKIQQIVGKNIKNIECSKVSIIDNNISYYDRLNSSDISDVYENIYFTINLKYVADIIDDSSLYELAVNNTIGNNYIVRAYERSGKLKRAWWDYCYYPEFAYPMRRIVNNKDGYFDFEMMSDIYEKKYFTMNFEDELYMEFDIESCFAMPGLIRNNSNIEDIVNKYRCHNLNFFGRNCNWDSRETIDKTYRNIINGIK